MKKCALMVAVALFVLAAYAGAAFACEGASKCPMQVKGAKVEVKNTDKGVTITISADDAAAVKDIQARAGKIGKEGCSCGKGEKMGEGHKCQHAKDKEAGSCGGDQSCKEKKMEEGKCPYAK